MKRYPAFDPPEYVDWTVDPDLLRIYIERTREDPARREAIMALSVDQLREIYANLLRTRLHDIGLKRWVKQGVISKAWFGTGEEAATVGPVSALTPGRDVVMPMIRNAGACLMMGMSVSDLFRAYLRRRTRLPRGVIFMLDGRSSGCFNPSATWGRTSL